MNIDITFAEHLLCTETTQGALMSEETYRVCVWSFRILITLFVEGETEALVG